MRKASRHDPRSQLGFDALMLEADRTNHARRVEQANAHLPGTMEEALPFLWELLDEHHTTMLAGQVDKVMFCREEAHRLAVKLNGGKAGILANETSPGCVLARETSAAPGTVPAWGQKGSFIVTVAGMRVRIEIEGIFGLFAAWSFWPSFSAHAVDPGRPFISETGYRSFLSVRLAPLPGLLPDSFAAEAIEAHLRQEMKGKLVAIEPRYRDRH